MSDQDVKPISLKELGLQKYEIPQELRDDMLWAVSTMQILDAKTGRRDKSPRNPHTGDRLSVTDKKGWVTFDEARLSGYPAIGMLLTADDPYVVIDLDKSNNSDDNERANRVFKAFPTYAEKSISGLGIHMVLRGPSQAGRRDRNVEVYSQERYIICTGDVYKDRPIAEGGSQLERLIKSLSRTDNPDTLPQRVMTKEIEVDAVVTRRMFDAQNGDKVKALFTTEPADSDDWSSLDARLASHICFYTKNDEQALRIFKKSKLYRGYGAKSVKSGYEDPRKYEEDYLIRRTFTKAWHLIEEKARATASKNDAETEALLERSCKPYDLTLVKNPETKMYEIPVDTSNGIVTYETILPPIGNPGGLVGEIAKFIYDNSPRPVWEVAIASALTYMSAITGRHFSISKSGLALYTVVMADTGRGKEAGKRGLAILEKRIAETVPDVTEFTGPSIIASGPALVKTLANSVLNSGIPSKLCILGEFGQQLKVMTDSKAVASEVTKKKILLELYSSSAPNSHFGSTAYADSANNTPTILSPNLSILGDTTQATFFKSVTEDTISDGLIARLLIVEYDGPRSASQDVMDESVPEDLLERLKTLVLTVLDMNLNSTFTNVRITKEAKEELDKFNQLCDSKINGNPTPTAELWNRGHLNSLRISAILAVGKNHFDPVVQLEDAKWAISLVKRSMLSYFKQIDTGDFGNKEDLLNNFVILTLKKYFDEKKSEKKKGYASRQKYREKGQVQYDYIANQIKLRGRVKSGMDSEVGSTRGLSGILQELISSGVLIEIREESSIENRSIIRNQRLFIKGDNYNSIYENETENDDI